MIKFSIKTKCLIKALKHAKGGKFSVHIAATEDAIFSANKEGTEILLQTHTFPKTNDALMREANIFLPPNIAMPKLKDGFMIEATIDDNEIILTQLNNDLGAYPRDFMFRKNNLRDVFFRYFGQSTFQEKD